MQNGRAPRLFSTTRRIFKHATATRDMSLSITAADVRLLCREEDDEVQDGKKWRVGLNDLGDEIEELLSDWYMRGHVHFVPYWNQITVRTRRSRTCVYTASEHPVVIRALFEYLGWTLLPIKRPRASVAWRSRWIDRAAMRRERTAMIARALHRLSNDTIKLILEYEYRSKMVAQVQSQHRARLLVGIGIVNIMQAVLVAEGSAYDHDIDWSMNPWQPVLDQVDEFVLDYEDPTDDDALRRIEIWEARNKKRIPRISQPF